MILILPLGKLSLGLAGLLWELSQNCDQKLRSLNLLLRRPPLSF